jgi:NAD(P)-dependent dehydrogenase (short-subunit alcohol dehydrogenase family)
LSRVGAELPLALVTGSHRRLGAHIALALGRAGYSLALHGSHDCEIEDWFSSELSVAGYRMGRVRGRFRAAGRPASAYG